MKAGFRSSINQIIMMMVVAFIVSCMVIFTGCRGAALPEGNDGEVQEEAEAAADAAENEEGQKQEDGSNSDGEEPPEGSFDSGSEPQDPEGESMEIPAEITEAINAAEDYFAQGLYAEAVHEYRGAIRIIENSDLPDNIKEELLGSIEANHAEAVNIVDTAKIHFSAAMNLEYEKRFEEAKVELEAALAIYPYYQTAIEALASLEALMGLE
ncbi:MAG: hypothetical protein JW770_06270 [Actinobacteria bacterium]|nr:hypothetical protein [Actinomycetota bacterium]